MACMQLIAECCNCHRLFTSNPATVPTANGQPICKRCVEWANPIRIARGLAPIPVAPDSYGSEETY